MAITPSPGNSICIRIRFPNDVESLAAVTSAIAKAGGKAGAIDIVESHRTYVIRDMAIDTTGDEQAQQITQAVKAVAGIEVVSVHDLSLIHI